MGHFCLSDKGKVLNEFNLFVSIIKGVNNGHRLPYRIQTFSQICLKYRHLEYVQKSFILVILIHSDLSLCHHPKIGTNFAVDPII